MKIDLNKGISTFERVTSSIENKFGQLSDLLISVKNSAKTLLFGSEYRKNENINWICAKLMNRIEVPINGVHDTINEKNCRLTPLLVLDLSMIHCLEMQLNYLT